MKKITDISRTIIALATALGGGSIAVIRISGQNGIRLVNNVFKGKDLTAVAANTIHFGRIIEGTREIDQVLVSVFKAPHSYTGEDYVEVSCHANPYIIDDILDLLIRQGARPAEAGEFTLRAFLNGKMDLSQAEAVAGIIRAKSRKGVHNSLEQLNGILTSKMMLMKEELVNIVGLMEIDLDFAEENIDVASKPDISSRLRILENDLRLLGSSFNYAKLLDSGIHLTLIGEPNAGKSTLLNQLLGENRAITSHIPGTTRDTIRENVVINDILFSLVDTAGLRESRDELEREGIKRTKSQVLDSDMVLLIVDASLTISALSWKLIQDTINWIQVPVIIVANKSDAGSKQVTISNLQKLNKPIVKMSAKTGKGLTNLENAIVKTISKGYNALSDDIIITSRRQKEVIEKTAEHINLARATLDKNWGFEYAAVDLRQALDILGELTGETITDDILKNIFSRFCIGK